MSMVRMEEEDTGAISWALRGDGEHCEHLRVTVTEDRRVEFAVGEGEGERKASLSPSRSRKLLAQVLKVVEPGEA